MHPIFVDLEIALKDIQAEARLMQSANARYAAVAAAPVDDIDRWIYLTALSAGVEKTYTGVEKMLVRIANEIDRHVPDGHDGHIALLRRMTVAVPGRRPAIISEATLSLLNQLRGFRHRVRNSYFEGLDPARVVENAELLPVAIDALVEDIAVFQKSFDDIG